MCVCYGLKCRLHGKHFEIYERSLVVGAAADFVVLIFIFCRQMGSMNSFPDRLRDPTVFFILDWAGFAVGIGFCVKNHAIPLPQIMIPRKHVIIDFF